MRYDGRKKADFTSPRQVGQDDIHSNGNGVWDTGNYAEKRQPEMVYYYPMLLELKANSFPDGMGCRSQASLANRKN